MGIPVFLVNARLSKRSFPRYKSFAFLFRPLFASFMAVGAQNENDAEKLRHLGCRSEAVHVVGSLKYDAATLDESQGLNVAAMLRQLGVGEGARVLVAGSTHAGEESLLARMALRLRTRFPDLFLVLVPRHFERGSEVGRELEALGMKFVYRSEVTAATRYETGSLACLLVNTTGELKHFYRAATLVFIGKSITAVGGQNPIEPAALGKAIVFGPNMQNFSDVASDFLRCEGAAQVKDAAELEKVIEELLEDGPRREKLGRNALEVVQRNQGALEHTVEMLVRGLAERDLYVAPHRERAAADPRGLLRET
jgi:3-deoxy-D-manno-octulosonic-acid transferase